MVLLFPIVLLAKPAVVEIDDRTLEKMIGQMLVIGFDQSSVHKEDKIIQTINHYNLGGVILFDKFYHNRLQTKNIRNSYQLRLLTKQLQSLSGHKIFIAVDQEGGKVARLKEYYGFSATPSAAVIGAKDDVAYAKTNYTHLAKMLASHHINLNFAPVVDLALNNKNRVIVGLERSYGSDPQKVAKYASIFMDAMEEEGVISVLKHFPGHGSSLDDSHEGFVDVTMTWRDQELEPYKALIKVNKVKMIMTAHVFNKQLDHKYPATLSALINKTMLREEMGYNGVIISDDLQMKAISAQYTLKETVTLAINAGVDLLLFGNQLSNTSTKTIIETIKEQVKAGNIPIEHIQEANERIKALLK
jgi:beta-N-acetylhexosaminidase